MEVNEEMTERKYVFSEESKDMNDALNRLSVIVFMLADDKPKLASEMGEALLTLQKFVNKYGYLEVMEGKDNDTLEK